MYYKSGIVIAITLARVINCNPKVKLQIVAPLTDDYKSVNETARFEKCKQLLEYQNLLLLSYTLWLKFYYIFNCCLIHNNTSVFRHMWKLKTAVFFIGVYYIMSYYNRRESTVNRALDGSFYPG